MVCPSLAELTGLGGAPSPGQTASRAPFRQSWARHPRPGQTELRAGRILVSLRIGDAFLYNTQVMNFECVLRELLQMFKQEKVRYALMGGFALGALGAPRATLDIDFLVHRDDLGKLDRRLVGLGYKRYHHTENVSQYENSKADWGGIDFIHAFRKISLAMLERAIEQPVFHGTQKVRVLQPEDVIGLKVQAIANNPRRKAQDVADIEALASLYHNRLDWDRLREYYSLFKMEKEFLALKKSASHAK